MIRPFIETDAELFRVLRLRALTEEPEAFGASAADFAQTTLPDMVQRFRQTDDAFVLGAWMPGLVGMVGVMRESGTKRRHKASVWGMYVAPEMRGQGVGRALLTDAITHAAGLLDLEQLLLHVVSSNTTAVGLYRSLGFITYGVEPHALKLGSRYVDEEWMALPLS